MINNIKINYKKISNNKFKIVKKALGIIAIFSIPAIVLSGCSLNFDKLLTKEENKYSYSYESNTDSSTYNNYDQKYSLLLNRDDTVYSNENILINEKEFSSFVDYLASLKTNYTYSNLYNINENLEKYYEIKKLNSQQHQSKIADITAEELFKTVKSNNKVYLKQKEEEYTSAFYEEFSDSKLMEICKIITATVNYYIDDISSIDELKCILGSLKIFEKTTLTNAYITDDNALMISPSMIETLRIRATKENQDVFKDTISHETIHLIQKSCTDVTNYYRIGNSFRFNDSEINSLFWNWYYEGAAEKLSNNFTSDDPLVYKYYIAYINSLSLSRILDSNIEIGQLEKTTLSNNLQSIYSYFNATTNDQQNELIKMMFSLDIIETDNEEFLSKLNLDVESDTYITVKRNLKTSVCETLTKYFYKTLINSLREEKIKINDIFYLITVFEADLDFHLNYSDDAKYKDNEEFVKKYVEIQKKFFCAIEKSNNYEQGEIENLFDTYGVLRSNGEKNYKLSFLSKEKGCFVDVILQNDSLININQIRDLLYKNTEKSK